MTGVRLWPDLATPSTVKCALLSWPSQAQFEIYYVAPELIGSADLGLTRVVFSELESCNAAFMAKLNTIRDNCDLLVGTGMDGSHIERREVYEYDLHQYAASHFIDLGYTPLFAFMSGFGVDGGNGTEKKLSAFDIGIAPEANGVRIYHRIKQGSSGWSDGNYMEHWKYWIQFGAIGSGTPTGYTTGLEFLIGDSPAQIMTKLNQLAVNCDLVGGSVFGDIFNALACTGKPPGEAKVNNGELFGPTNPDGSMGIEVPFQPTFAVMGGFKGGTSVQKTSTNPIYRFNEHRVWPVLEGDLVGGIIPTGGVFAEENQKVGFTWRINDSGNCNPHHAYQVVPYTFLYIPPTT